MGTVSTIDDVYFTAPVVISREIDLRFDISKRSRRGRAMHDIDPFDRAGAARLAAWIGIVIEGRQTGAEQPVAPVS